MKLNKIMLAASVALGMASLAHAADPVKPVDQGKGVVRFHGSIIEAPCSIDPDSVDQTVELGEISAKSLKDNGTSTPQNFEIKLKDCSLETQTSVTATFTGAAGDMDTLGITGDASGAGIVMTSGEGTKIKLGEPTKPQALQDGDNILNFAAYLQGTSASIVPGEFTSVSNFTLAYD